jgi:hypothetical protein
MAEDRIQLQPELTGVALAYRNNTCIADKVFNDVTVEQRSFQYRKYDKETFLTLPETRIGEKGEANRVEIKGKLVTDSVEEHAIENSISISRQKEAQNAVNKVDLSALTIAQLTDILLLRREVNLATLLSTPAIYKGNVKKLEENEKINNPNVNAVKLIQDAADSMVYKPNKMILSRKAYSALRQNKYVVSAVNKNDSEAGIVPLDEIKTLFELDEILVGESFFNVAKRGATPNYAACWQNDIILTHNNNVATVDYGITFGYRAIYEKITIGSYFDGRSGTQGADVYKAYTSYKDVIACPECGYLIEGAV